MEISINFLIKIIIIFIIILAITVILFIKFSSDFFSENSTSNKLKDSQSDPYVLDEEFIKSLEFQHTLDTKLDDINKNFKEINKEIINYKLKLNNIDSNIELLLKDKLSIKEITTPEALDMMK
jgi:septal ring factor EnvC (AmiA/AmiB activator)